MNKALVIAVHPDDETLGCGGTLLRHKDRGDEIYWLILTAITVEQGFDQDAVARRSGEIEKVSQIYGFDDVEQLGFPTMHLDKMPFEELIEKISAIIMKVEPNIIYLPHKGDVHSDHRIAFWSAYSCTKSFRYPFIKKIFMMETISETEFAPATKEDTFVPNVFIDISSFLEKKIEIMKMYTSELGKPPFPRNTKNIEALATFRGAMAGCRYAESFMLLKEII